jgi:hypothetical protein
MKKFILASLALLMALLVTVPAQANDGAAIVGGVIGGLILGDILRNGHGHRHSNGIHYRYEDDYYYQACWIEYVRVWDHYRHRYVTKKVRYCD